MVKRTVILRVLGYILYLLLPIGALQAQQIQVEAPSEVEAGRPFSVSYVIKDIGVDRLSVAEQPSHSGLELLYGPATSRSSSVNIVNGRVSSSSSISYTYTFLASTKGTFSISGFSLVLDGKKITARTSKIQSVQVTRSSSSSGGLLSAVKQYHYIASVSKRSVYEQEALPVTYKLYAQSSINLVDTKAPVYDGFISHNLKADAPRQIMREEYRGALYNTVEMYKELIYPQKSGQLEIPTNKMTIQVPLEMEDDPFLGQLVDKTLSTQPIIIQVKPLPETNKPANFSGAVGQFTVSQELSSKALKTNEAFTVKYVFKGSGNLKMAKIPQLTFPRELEVYPPSDQTKDEQTSSDVVTTTRTIEYSIIPRQTGRYTLPSLNLSYFDPKAEQYRSIETTPTEVEVTLGRILDNVSEVVNPSQVLENAYSLSCELGSSEPDGWGFVASWFYLLSYVILGLIAFVLGSLIKREMGRRADFWGYGASRAKSVATKRLKLAERYAAQGKDNEFYEEVLRAMWDYVARKLKLQGASLNRAAVADLLKERGISDEKVVDWVQIMDDVEFARFAPGREELKPQTVYNKAVDIIAHIEAHIQ